MKHYIIENDGVVVGWGSCGEDNFNAGEPQGLRWLDAPYSEAPAAPQVSLSLVADTDVVPVGASVTVTATLSAPIDATFAVPIEDESGVVVKIKAVQFVAGAATVSLTFDKSGYYRLTEAAINRKLPPEARIALVGPFEITVFE